MRRMIDPVEGLPAKTDFIPSVKMVKEFIEGRMPRPAVVPEHKLLLAPDEEEISQEERARRADMLHKLAREMRAVTKAKCIGRPTLEWKHQEHGLEELFRIARSDVHR